MSEKDKRKRQPQSWRQRSLLIYGIAALWSLAILVLTIPPHYSTFTAQRTLDDVYILFTGLLGMMFLVPSPVNPILLFLFRMVVVFVLTFVVDYLRKYRIFKVLLIGALSFNLLFGSFGFWARTSIGRIDDNISCEQYITETIGVRADTYLAVDSTFEKTGQNTEIDFYLATIDSGKTWQQISFEAGRHFIRSSLDCTDWISYEVIDDKIIRVDFKYPSRALNEFITTDGGITWQLDMGDE